MVGPIILVCPHPSLCFACQHCNWPLPESASTTREVSSDFWLVGVTEKTWLFTLTSTTTVLPPPLSLKNHQQLLKIHHIAKCQPCHANHVMSPSPYDSSVTWGSRCCMNAMLSLIQQQNYILKGPDPEQRGSLGILFKYCLKFVDLIHSSLYPITTWRKIMYIKKVCSINLCLQNLLYAFFFKDN